MMAKWIYMVEIPVLSVTYADFFVAFWFQIVSDSWYLRASVCAANPVSGLQKISWESKLTTHKTFPLGLVARCLFPEREQNAPNYLISLFVDQKNILFASILLTMPYLHGDIFLSAACGVSSVLIQLSPRLAATIQQVFPNSESKIYRLPSFLWFCYSRDCLGDDGNAKNRNIPIVSAPKSW